MANHEINLINKQANAVSNLGTYERIAKQTAWWGLLSFLVVGAIIGSLYLYSRVTLSQLEAENEKLAQAISVQNVKEGILLSLQVRTQIAQKALSSVSPWGQLFPLLLQMAPPVAYISFEVDVLGKVITQLEVGTIEEAIAITRAAILLSDEKLIKFPQLSSLVIKEDGKVNFGISFIPTF